MNLRSLICGTFALVMSLSLAGVASAEKPGKKPRKERTPEQQAEFVKRYDKDGDGKLSESEKASAKEDMKKNRKGKGKGKGEKKEAE